MKMGELLKKALGYLLMSMGVSSPAKKPAPGAKSTPGNQG
jgi:hypothetical protein